MPNCFQKLRTILVHQNAVEGAGHFANCKSRTKFSVTTAKVLILCHLTKELQSKFTTFQALLKVDRVQHKRSNRSKSLSRP